MEKWCQDHTVLKMTTAPYFMKFVWYITLVTDTINFALILSIGTNFILVTTMKKTARSLILSGHTGWKSGGI